MKTKLTRKVSKELKAAYPSCFVEVDEERNGDGECAISVIMTRAYELGFFRKSETNVLKEILENNCGEQYIYCVRETERNAAVSARAEILI